MEKGSSPFAPGWLPLVTGGLPHTDPIAAWQAVLSRFPELPGWPRLPRRSPLENMYTQYSERFPGLMAGDGSSLMVRRTDLDAGIEELYLAYLEGDLTYGEMSPDYASALDVLLKGQIALPTAPLAIRGEITGPVSWGLTVVDQDRRPILYDEVMEDAVGKHLQLKAGWQESALKRVCPTTIMMVNEPYMSSYGTPAVPLSPTRIVELFDDVLAGLSGLKGIQCSGTTDWSLLMRTSADLIAFDAYDYVDSFATPAEDVARFMDRGGILVWGIVPAGGAARTESVDSLVARLEAGLDLLAEAGVSRERLVRQAMVTPSASLASLNVPLAEQVLDLTAGVSAAMQQRYMLQDSPAEGSPDEPEQPSEKEQ